MIYAALGGCALSESEAPLTFLYMHEGPARSPCAFTNLCAVFLPLVLLTTDQSNPFNQKLQNCIAFCSVFDLLSVAVQRRTAIS